MCNRRASIGLCERKATMVAENYWLRNEETEMKALCVLAIVTSVFSTVNVSQAETVLVTQVSQVRMVSHSRHPTFRMPSPIVPLRSLCVFRPLIWIPPTLPAFPPPRILSLARPYRTPTVVIDERVIHTGSYNVVRLTGDVYTPSYLAAREQFERSRRR